jgi:ribonuclease HI
MIVDTHAIEVWSDGSCVSLTRYGGWGAVLRMPQGDVELWGGERDTTVNAMELTAVIQALSALKRPCAVRVFTDSKYVANGWDDYMPIWKKNGWLNYEGNPVKNRELWETLDKAASAHRVIFHWIKGHRGLMFNERADRLARRGRDELRPFGT